MVKVEVKADLTNTVGKINEEVIMPPAKEASSGFVTVLKFINTAIDNATYKYIEISKKKKEAFINNLNKQYNNIPDNKKCDPDIRILGTVMDNLRYSLDNDFLVDMYTNILVSDMNSDKKGLIHISYVEILKQLNKNDLLVLEAIYKLKTKTELPIGKLIIVNENNKPLPYSLHTPIYLCKIDNYSLTNYNEFSISIENLNRLGLININFTEWFSSEGAYDELINNAYPTCGHILNNIKKEYANAKLGCTKGLLTISNLGNNLMKICLNEV